MKFIITAVMALAFTVTAQAKTTKVPGTKMSKTVRETPKDYTSSYSSPAYGEGSFTHEFTTNLTQGFYLSEKACKDCSTGSNLTVAGSYLHYWKDNMQYGAEGALRVLSKEVTLSRTSETLIDILAIGAYNFDSNLKNSIYAKAGVGFFAVPKNDLSGYENKFGLFVGVGKRFSWMNNISYTPELRLVKKGDIDMGIELALLNFSIYW
ncbi:MAG: hypothetical protein ACXVCY_14005 [Pseudobdellovibrionaceae bacterium]